MTVTINRGPFVNTANADLGTRGPEDTFYSSKQVTMLAVQNIKTQQTQIMEETPTLDTKIWKKIASVTNEYRIFTYRFAFEVVLDCRFQDTERSTAKTIANAITLLPRIALAFLAVFLIDSYPAVEHKKITIDYKQQAMDRAQMKLDAWLESKSTPLVKEPAA
jgi:hypothetical protein